MNPGEGAIVQCELSYSDETKIEDDIGLIEPDVDLMDRSLMLPCAVSKIVSNQTLLTISNVGDTPQIVYKGTQIAYMYTTKKVTALDETDEGMACSIEDSEMNVPEHLKSLVDDAIKN